LADALRSVTEFGFSRLGGRECVFLFYDGFAAGVFELLRLGGIELDVFFEFGGNIRLGIDGFDRAFGDASLAVNAIIGVNDQLAIQLVEAGDGADLDAVSEFAAVAFAGDDMRHKLSFG
jgi:hypothetical protein